MQSAKLYSPQSTRVLAAEYATDNRKPDIIRQATKQVCIGTKKHDRKAIAYGYMRTNTCLLMTAEAKTLGPQAPSLRITRDLFFVEYQIKPLASVKPKAGIT